MCSCLTELFEIELFFDIKTVFTLNWIVTYNCLNSLKWKCFWHLNCILMLNWIVLNRTDCYVLTFDRAPKNSIPRWCTGRKWHIPMASNRKRSRGRIKAYNMRQGEGPTFPIQTDAPEESDLWTAWQLFPLDGD